MQSSMIAEQWATTKRAADKRKQQPTIAQWMSGGLRKEQQAMKRGWTMPMPMRRTIKEDEDDNNGKEEDCEQNVIVDTCFFMSF